MKAGRKIEGERVRRKEKGKDREIGRKRKRGIRGGEEEGEQRREEDSYRVRSAREREGRERLREATKKVIF